MMKGTIKNNQKCHMEFQIMELHMAFTFLRRRWMGEDLTITKYPHKAAE